MNEKIEIIVRSAIIAAIYVVLTAANPLSYNQLQFRISEVLVLLCFFRKDYIYGLTLGCIIANAFGPLGPLDIIFGSIATLISCFCISSGKNLIVAAIYPVFFNGLIVGLELWQITKTPFLLCMLSVMAGEAVVMIFAVVIFYCLSKKQEFLKLIKATQNKK